MTLTPWQQLRMERGERTDIPFRDIPLEMKTPWQLLKEKRKQVEIKEDEFMKGNVFNKIFDPLLVGQYAIAGIGRQAMGLEAGAGIIEGIKKRATWIDTFQEKFPYEATDDWKRNFIYELARVTPGVLADIILDPLWLIPPLKIAKMFGAPIKGFGKVASQILRANRITAHILDTMTPKIKQTLGKAFIYRYGQPKAYQDIAERTMKEIEDAEETYLRLVKPIIERPVEERAIITRIMKKEKLPKELDKLTLTQLKELAKPGIEEFKRLGREAVRLELLDEATFRVNFGKYLPRLYRTKEMPEGAMRFVGDRRPIRINLDRFMVKRDAFGVIYQPARFAKSVTRKFTTREARDAFIDKITTLKFYKRGGRILRRFEPIPEDIRIAMGEIQDAGYITSRGLSTLRQSIEKAKFFRQVARTPEWTSKTRKPGFTRLPEVKTLGELSGKWVLDPIYDDIMQWQRVVSKGEIISRIGLGIWKYFKVIANPATHGRNMISNIMLADMGGLPFYRVDYWAKGLRDLAQHGKYYQELKANSRLLTGTFARGDIMDLLRSWEISPGRNMFSKSMNMVKKIMRKGGNIYQAEEQWAKVSLYSYLREVKKMSIEKAIKITEESLFDYRKVPPFIDFLRGGRGITWGSAPALGILSGAYPFITFSYKALPFITKVALTKTPALTKWAKMVRGVEELSPDQQVQAEKEIMSEWMKKGYWMKVPLVDQYNRSYYLDLRFIVPWGDVGEVGYRLEPHHPVYVLLADLVRNKSAFTDRPIVPPGTPEGFEPGESYYIMTDYVLKTILPSLIPPGYSYDRISEAILQKPDYLGRTRHLFLTFLDVAFGLKTRPLDFEEETYWRERDKSQKIQDIQSRMISINLSQALTSEEKEKRLKRLEKELQEIIEEYP